MKKNILFKFLTFKIMILFSKSFYRQNLIDKLEKYIKDILKEFDKKKFSLIKKQIESIEFYEVDKLFYDSFFEYKLLCFGKTLIDVDDFKMEDCRTYKQYNYLLMIAMVVLDSLKNE